eukprot:3726859-Rhodomonas_salina.2
MSAAPAVAWRSGQTSCKPPVLNVHRRQRKSIAMDLGAYGVADGANGCALPVFAPDGQQFHGALCVDGGRSAGVVDGEGCSASAHARAVAATHAACCRRLQPVRVSNSLAAKPFSFPSRLTATAVSVLRDRRFWIFRFVFHVGYQGGLPFKYGSSCCVRRTWSALRLVVSVALTPLPLLQALAQLQRRHPAVHRTLRQHIPTPIAAAFCRLSFALTSACFRAGARRQVLRCDRVSDVHAPVPRWLLRVPLRPSNPSLPHQSWSSNSRRS